MARPKGIALALGGGGARGLSHIGVLKVLYEEGIAIGAIVGSSVGALIGAMFCINPDPEDLEQKWREFLESDAFDDSGLSHFREHVSEEEEEDSFLRQVTKKVRGRIIINIVQSRMGLVKRNRLACAVEYLIGEKEFSDCRIPLTVMATDLTTGEPVKLTDGDLQIAVEASSSIPGFIPPLEIDGRILVDGSVSVPVPVRQARETNARPVVGVGVSRRISQSSPATNAIEILTRTELISSFYFSRQLLDEADVSILPETGNAHWSEFSRMGEMIEKGEEAARRAMPEIRKAKRRAGFWGRVFMGRA